MGGFCYILTDFYPKLNDLTESSIRDNHSRGKVGDFLKSHIEPDSELTVVSAFFTIYAYYNLKDKLDAIKHMRFLFGEPRFLAGLDPEKVDKKEFKIEDENLVIPVERRLKQRNIAKLCADWLRSKADIKSMVKPNFLHGKLYHVTKPSGVTEAIVGSSNFTVNGLGLGSRPNIELNMITQDKRDVKDLKAWFDELWNRNDTEFIQDVKEEVLKYLEQLYVDNDPEFIYYKTLFHVFENYLAEQQKGGLLDGRTGFFESEIWNMLYDFQKDGVKGAINKIEKHGGCILADSVGLGKTFEALAVIRYYELKNARVLVLCPKKLSQNWTIYQAQKNQTLNPFTKDRFGYTVMYHTDLGRIHGITEADGIDIANFNWGAYDLVVVDESHNFRNSKTGKELENGEYKPSRYERLMNDIVKKGVKTKVLLLSATPVNNSLRDLRNQIYFITEQDDRRLAETAKISNIGQTIKTAQDKFTRWSKQPVEERTVKNLLESLDSSFFTLLDELTIARSRKHIEKGYDIEKIGKFPERLKPLSLYPKIDLKGEFPTYDQINKKIVTYRLSLFNPSAYLQEDKKAEYAEKADTDVMNFSQEIREHFLIGMMKVNFLKRLESSIESFQISMARTIDKIDTLLSKIDKFRKKVSDNPEIDFGTISEDEADEEDREIFQNLFVGKKLRFNLAHIQLDKWVADLNNDRNSLFHLYEEAKRVTVERDAKLADLKNTIANKIQNPLNGDNKKVLVFTAFADTAEYLYTSLYDWVTTDLKLNIALVSGGSLENKSSFIPKGFKRQSDFDSILANFAPIAKNRVKMASMPQDGTIDILIATDCISEGQNLQDCDCLINYDIHWNPVRIIQRFGRIDRLGSKNQKIQLVNFWPTADLDNYINLKERVEARMALVDVAATGEENLLNAEQLEDLIQEDLKFRNKQLKKLKEVVLDLEELDENVSLSEFTLDDFRIDLSNFIEKNKTKLKEAPLGLHALVPSPSGRFAKPDRSSKFGLAEKEIIKSGVIFCFRQINHSHDLKDVNPLNPHFLIYIRDDGTVRYRYIQAKQILEVYRLLCVGVTAPYSDLCELFNRETNNGDNLEPYSEMLSKAIKDIQNSFTNRAHQQILSNRSAVLVPAKKNPTSDNSLELITWLIIK